MTEFSLALAVFFLLCFLCAISFILSLVAVIMVVALKNSTLKIEWRSPVIEDDLGNPFMTVDQLNKKLKDENEKIEDDLL